MTHGKEKEILKVLYETRHWITVNEVAEKTEMSWNTAEKYVELLHKRGWVRKQKRQKREYYTVHKE